MCCVMCKRDPFRGSFVLKHQQKSLHHKDEGFQINLKNVQNDNYCDSISFNSMPVSKFMLLYWLLFFGLLIA